MYLERVTHGSEAANELPPGMKKFDAAPPDPALCLKLQAYSGRNSKPLVLPLSEPDDVTLPIGSILRVWDCLPKQSARTILKPQVSQQLLLNFGPHSRVWRRIPNRPGDDFGQAGKAYGFMA